MFSRYFFVGFLNTIVGYALFAIFVKLGTHYSLSLFLATIFGIGFNFFSIGRFVFRNLSHKLIYKFILVYALTYFSNVVVLRGFVILGVSPMLGQFIIALPMAYICFLAQRRFVFHNE